MTRFVQIHSLTFYPPSNLNRDDLGRPKTAIIGDTQRLRLSSQSLKRAWRTSDVFAASLSQHLGKRTKRIGEDAEKALKEKGVSDKKAAEWAQKIAGVFGKTAKDSATIEQLAHVSPEELASVDKLVATLAKRGSGPEEAELELLRGESTSVDIAMFGRMLAAKTEFNVDAAVQVAHAFTVHPVTVEDDYFTAVDDLKPREEDAGAGHVGVHEFGSGIFYSYVCVQTELLEKNLGGNKDLARKAIEALVEAIATVGPGGKQNSFASRAKASYVMVEKGDRQPRTLALAFLDGVQGQPLMRASIDAIETLVTRYDKAYGPAEERASMDIDSGSGSMGDLKKFAAE